MARKKKTQESLVYLVYRAQIQGYFGSNGHSSLTFYVSVPVVAPRPILSETDCLSLLEKGTGSFFDEPQSSSISREGAFHRHRSIDEMRMHHSFNQRREIFSRGCTTPGHAPFSVWAAYPISGPQFKWPLMSVA